MSPGQLIKLLHLPVYVPKPLLELPRASLMHDLTFVRHRQDSRASWYCRWLDGILATSFNLRATVVGREFSLGSRVGP